jgi:hypothetical protein
MNYFKRGQPVNVTLPEKDRRFGKKIRRDGLHGARGTTNLGFGHYVGR